MNDHEIRELVKSELPYPQLTDRANIAFEKAYLALRPCAERGDARRQASEEGWKEERLFSVRPESTGDCGQWLFPFLLWRPRSCF